MPDDTNIETPELASLRAVEIKLSAIEQALNGMLERLEDFDAKLERQHQRILVAEATIEAQTRSQDVAFDSITELRNWVTKKISELANAVAAESAANDASTETAPASDIPAEPDGTEPAGTS